MKGITSNWLGFLEINMLVTNLTSNDIERLTEKVSELMLDNPNIKMQVYHESRYDRRKWKKKWKFNHNA